MPPTVRPPPPGDRILSNDTWRSGTLHLTVSSIVSFDKPMTVLEGVLHKAEERPYLLRCRPAEARFPEYPAWECSDEQ